MNNIKVNAEPFHNQADAAIFAVDYIKTHGSASQSVLESEYEEWLLQLHRNYENVFEADLELVCNEKIERKNKCMENLSNHGIYEIDHDILTVNIREANRLGYKTPHGLKFKEKWFMTRAKVDYYGVPVHDTVSWDKNEKRLNKK